MLYKVKAAKILPDGSVKTGKRELLWQNPTVLIIGGLYVLGHLKRKRLYQIVAEVAT